MPPQEHVEHASLSIPQGKHAERIVPCTNDSYIEPTFSLMPIGTHRMCASACACRLVQNASFCMRLYVHTEGMHKAIGFACPKTRSYLQAHALSSQCCHACRAGPQTHTAVFPQAHSTAFLKHEAMGHGFMGYSRGTCAGAMHRIQGAQVPTCKLEAAKFLRKLIRKSIVNAHKLFQDRVSAFAPPTRVHHPLHP